MSTGHTTTTYRFDEFIFDCRSHQLLCNGTERHVAPKAQQLLELLLIERPRAVSRKELYDALWPSTFVCESNLSGVIKELRRALGEEGRASQYIRTVHGFGYAFCGEVTASAPSAVTLTCDGDSYNLTDGEHVIGRADDCAVVIESRTISRRHAVISVRGGLVSIKDLESTNGTYVNGRRVGSEFVPVQVDTGISFGNVAASIFRRKVSSTTRLKLSMPELKRIVAAAQCPD